MLPQVVVIYHAGSGKIAFLGILRCATIVIFLVSALVVVYVYDAVDDTPWYTLALSESSSQ
jgi:hypothetical protein